MKRWFVLSAIGQDRPGLVAELAQLVYDSDANLEDSRMTFLETGGRRVRDRDAYGRKPPLGHLSAREINRLPPSHKRRRRTGSESTPRGVLT